MSERRQRLLPLLDELLEADAETRAEKLAHIAVEDPDLAAELTRLIAADERSGLLDGGLAQAAPTLMGQLAEPDTDTPRAAAGKRIGHYRLLERLGSGGMGDVWRAERDDGEFEQQVAIKLIRPLLDSPQLRERFARERRILARLDHPNVARLLDGGVSDDGTPWYAMEFVNGVDIVRYANERSLDARARVLLLLQVCDAVAHSQAQLVVHRDIKPSNILVDEQGRARVLDFGIARLLDDSADLKLTGTGVRVFSPSYAAPEQIRGDAIGTATDVFALGAVLYELLAGEVPHPQRSAAPDRLIAELDRETAPRPSQVPRRHTDGATLGTRDYAGDLDTIVATALQPEPARRYAGAAQLADDLRRWLDGRPIAARADTAGYRIAKFIGRHRLAVGSASSMLLVLIAGFGIALWQANVAREHAARADAEARRANAEATRAESEAAKVKAQVARVKKVKDFLVSVFLQADPLRRSDRGPLTFDQAFDAALERARSELADDPVLQADVFDDFGEVRTGQGRFDEAEALFKQALAVAEKEYGPNHPTVAESLVNLASLASYRERPLDGAAEIERAVAILEKDDGGDPLALANALGGLAALRQAQGRLGEGLVAARRSLAISRAHIAPDDLVLSVAITNVAMMEVNADHPAAGQAGLEEAIGIVEKRQGANSPRLLPALSQLGDIYYAQGKMKEAAQAAQRALDIARKNYPGDHPWTAGALADLGWAKANDGDYAGGVPLLRDSIAMYDRLKSPRVVIVLRLLGVQQKRHGDNADALASFTRAWEVCRSSGLEAEQHCVVTRGNRAHMLALAGRGKEALSEVDAALVALEKLSSDGLWSERAQMLQARAAAYVQMDRRDDARAQQEAAIALLRKAFGDTHGETRAAIGRLEAMR